VEPLFKDRVWCRYCSLWSIHQLLCPPAARRIKADAVWDGGIGRLLDLLASR
jgi:hypothetical protein